MAFLFAWSRFWSHFRNNLVFLPLVKISTGEFMWDNLCSIQKFVCRQLKPHDFSQVLKLCSCTAPQNEIQLLSRFFCSFSKLNCLLISFLSRKVLQRDSSSSMALFVLVHAHSVDYRKTLLTFQIFFVFFHCCHKMKYSCYQDSSNVKSWFVYLGFGLRKALPWD